MRGAVVQLSAGEDKDDNLARLGELIDVAAGQGASLVVAPEAAMHGFHPLSLPLAPVAEPLDGAFVTGLAERAAAHRLTVVAGMFELVPDDPMRAYNTVVAIGPSGELVGRYRKQHLFDALGWRESARLLPGAAADLLVVPVDDALVGVMTCYDLRFPELARALVDDGATVLAVPSAWVAGPGKEQQWSTLAAARAIENVCYVAGAAQPPPAYTGNACVVDPLGVTLASLADEEGVAVAEFSAARVAACRARMPSLQHRRWTVAPRSDPPPASGPVTP
jgi:predicted amidohydrolase